MEGNYVFVLFVVAMSLLFLILLLKRLCRKPSSTDITFGTWNLAQRGNPNGIQNISTLVQNRDSAANQDYHTRSHPFIPPPSNYATESPPPPPFESVVAEPKQSMDDGSYSVFKTSTALASDYDLPPPSYDEYLQECDRTSVVKTVR